MSNEYEIDTELLITLIESRPVIWDKTLEDYKNKNLTAKAWKEICNILVGKYDTADNIEKAEICKSVQKKWTNLRDAWMKNVKKDKDQKKSGSGAKIVKKYIYHEQMLFLQKISAMRATESSLTEESEHVTTDPTEDDSNSQASTSMEVQTGFQVPFGTKKNPMITPTTSKIKKKKVDEFENKILQELQTKPEENRHMCFFKGILPSINDFTDNQVMDFQMGVLSLIKNIKRSSANPNPPFTSNFVNHSPPPLQTNYYELANPQMHHQGHPFPRTDNTNLGSHFVPTQRPTPTYTTLENSPHSSTSAPSTTPDLQSSASSDIGDFTFF